ncbi:MAG: pilin [Thermotogota bacterium]|nr:pilin [Thermotogota bacterium]
MKSNKLKFLSFLFLSLFLCFSVSSFIFANNGLEIKYPPLNGIEITTSTTISEYAVYFFSLGIIIAAVIAFVVLTYGGIRYLLSFNNPGAMKDAIKWISSGAVGLFIMLCSYLILSTINPEIVAPSIEDVKPISGIYLINNESEKYYLAGDKNNISFKASSIEFISDEDELLSVFVCSEKTFNGENSKEIKNNSGSSVSNVKSIYFLWNNPGVYLYTKSGEGTPPPPLFLQTGANEIKGYDNRTKSITTRDPEDESSYLSILFSEPNFEGEHGIGVAISEKDFNINNVQGSISSIDISNVAPINQSSSGGSVTFYDDIECAEKEENGHSEEVKAGDSPGGSSLSQFNKFGKSIEFNAWDVLSFEIKEGCWVIFNTEKNFSGRSHIFKGGGCYSSLKGTYVYLPHPEDGRKPKIATVFCSP